jgi:hypothetical protein
MDFIDPIFNMHKIKFDTLDKWNFVDKSITRAIVYINLENVFRIIMTPRTNNFLQAAASVDEHGDYMKKFSLSLVSNIINLAQHYRLWLTKQNIDSRIILYWNYPIPEDYKNRLYIPTYRTTHNERYQRNMEISSLLECLEEAQKFIETCIQYVNEVYLINPLGIESSVIPLLLDREVYSEDGVKTMNILVTSSQYEYSYVNYGFKIISPSIRKKTPILVTDKNVIDVLKNKCGVSSVLSAPTGFIEFINAVMGDSDRSIPKLTGVGIATILKLINSAITKGLISENTKDVEMFESIIQNDYREIFVRNYHCTNLEYQLKDIEPVELHKIKSCLIDKYDDATLNEMNEKYFKQFPIEIIKPKTQQILYDNQSPYESIFARR